MANRPLVVAFDVIETLFPLDLVRSRIEQLGIPADKTDLWFAQILRDGFALTACGAFEPFQQVAEGELDLLLLKNSVEPSPDKITSVMSAFKELIPSPDALLAIPLVKEAGLRVVTLSNGSAESIQCLIESGGLSELVDDVYTINDVRKWKPHPDPYLHTARSLGIEPGQLALVTVHSWDVLGAHNAGLITGWASRLEDRFVSVMGKPDVSGSSLVEVVDGLLGLPEV